MVNNNWGNSIGGILYDANSSYNSFQMALERRMSPGLYVRLNYTLSECMEDSADDLPASELNGGGAAWTPTYAHNANRHRCSFQGLNSANLSLNYDLPFFRNAASRLTKTLMAGWQFTSLTAISSGVPFDIRTGVNESRAVNNGNGNSHPDLVAGCTPQNMVNKGNVVNYFKLSCLSVPALGYLGDLPPLYLTGPVFGEYGYGVEKGLRYGRIQEPAVGRRYVQRV